MKHTPYFYALLFSFMVSSVAHSMEGEFSDQFPLIPSKPPPRRAHKTLTDVKEINPSPVAHSMGEVHFGPPPKKPLRTFTFGMPKIENVTEINALQLCSRLNLEEFTPFLLQKPSSWSSAGLSPTTSFCRFLFKEKILLPPRCLILKEGITTLTIDLSDIPDKTRDLSIPDGVVGVIKSKAREMLQDVKGGESVRTFALKFKPEDSQPSEEKTAPQADPAPGKVHIALLEAVREHFPRVDGLDLTGITINADWVDTTPLWHHTIVKDGIKLDVPLRHLNLSRTHINSHDLLQILTFVLFLRELDLSYNDLEDEDKSMNSICEGVKKCAYAKHLEQLNLSHNKIKESAKEILPAFRHLEALDLSYNQIGDGEGHALRKTVKESNLKFFSIDCNPFTEETKKSILEEKKGLLPFKKRERIPS